MWIALIILGLLLIYTYAMCQAVGRHMQLPDGFQKLREQREQIAKGEHHDQTHRPQDQADHHRGTGELPLPDLAQKPGHQTDDITRYAYQALDRAIQPKGEK